MAFSRLLSLFFITVLFACQATSQQSNPQEAIAERMDAAAFSDKLASLEHVQLVDVRTPEEHEAGTIPNAVNMNFFGDDFEQQISTLDKSLPVMVFCQGGTEKGRSARTLTKLQELGFKEIYELKGGYGGWPNK